MGDEAVAIVAPNGDAAVVLDESGVVTMTVAARTYKRVAVSSGEKPSAQAAQK